jgi:hypothetical protein
MSPSPSSVVSGLPVTVASPFLISRSGRVLTYRDGKLVKFQTAGDTALLERAFGSK